MGFLVINIQVVAGICPFPGHFIIIEYNRYLQVFVFQRFM